jgi:hypothetical protein
LVRLPLSRPISEKPSWCQPGAPVAGKSILNRLELSRPEPTRFTRFSYKSIAIKRLLVDLFVEAHQCPPGSIVLDLDATDDPVHGDQEGRFFRGYYDCYCYLPLVYSAAAIC